MSITLDKARLVKIRKAKKMTQAELAAELKVSLRTYSAYESSGEETLLSSLEIARLANALRCPAHFLWGSLPHSAILYWQHTENYSLVAQFIAEQRFGNLKVDGVPSDADLREPLLKLIDVFEKEYEDGSKPKLSEKIRTRFACEDAVDQLRNTANDIPAKFYIVKVPCLRVTPDYYYNDETDTEHTWFNYIWTTQIDALISFDNSFDPETRPLNYSNYRSGATGIFFDYDEYGDEVITESVQEALNARPAIELEETENIELKAEPVSFDMEAGEAELKVSKGKKSSSGNSV